MKRNCTIFTSILLLLLLSSCGGEAQQTKPQAETASAGPQRGACDFLTKADVETITGIQVTNVTSRDRGTFVSCSYETEDWQNTMGVIYYPSLASVEDSAALADFLRQDLEKDQAPYKTPEPVEGLGDAAAYYVDEEGFMHFVAVQKGSQRIVVSAKSRDAAMKLAQKALQSM